MSAPAYSSYAERYDDPSQDPFEGSYREVLETFAAKTTREANTIPAKILTRVVSTTEVQPHAYLMLHQLESDEPYVTLIHRPFNIVPLMGQDQPEQTYCFLGDVSEMIPPQVAFFPVDAFESCGNVRVPTEDVLDGAITEASPICGPYADGEVGTEVVAVRRMMYLPPCFVSLALAHPRLSTYDAWSLLGGAIRNEADDEETSTTIEDYRPLLNWLRVSCTYTTKDGKNVLATAVSDPLTFPIHLDSSVRNKIKTILKSDLPGYGTSASPSSELATVSAINALTSRITEVNDAAVVREQRSKEKTPNDYFGEGVVVLLRVCHVSSSPELPRIWHAIAGSTKRHERMVIEEHFRATADNLSLLPFVPHVSAALTKKICSLSFAHYDMDDLEEGIHPFLATFKDQRAKSDATRVSSLYDDVMLGAGAPLADLAALRAAEKVGIPLDLISVGYTYQGFRIILHALLGAGHAFTRAYDNFVAAFLREEHFIATVLPSVATPGQLVRHTQIRVSNWFSKQVIHPERVPVPDFQDMLTKIRYQEAWAPRMPGAHSYPAPTSHVASPVVLPAVPTVPPSRSPGLTTQPTAATAVSSTSGRGTRISNPSYHTDFAPFKALGLPLKSVRDKASAGNKPVPKNTAGTEHCLSFHVNGFCWDNCSRKDDHRTHKAPEHKALLEWCKTCYRSEGPA